MTFACKNYDEFLKYQKIKHIIKHGPAVDLLDHDNFDIEYIIKQLKKNKNYGSKCRIGDDPALVMHLINNSNSNYMTGKILISLLYTDCNNVSKNYERWISSGLFNYITNVFTSAELLKLIKKKCHHELAINIIETIHNKHNTSYKHIMLRLIYGQKYNKNLFKYLFDKINECDDALGNNYKPSYDPLNLGFGIMNNKYYEMIETLSINRCNPDNFIGSRVNVPIIVILLEDCLRVGYPEKNRYHILFNALKHKKTIKKPAILNVARYIVLSKLMFLTTSDNRVSEILNIKGSMTMLDIEIFLALVLITIFCIIGIIATITTIIKLMW